ncbi:MAG: hypothetical protein J5995_08830 [Muribaculaceae bacterium]|nr:hypothetical protein [Muribaculaceae bacterium]
MKARTVISYTVFGVIAIITAIVIYHFRHESETPRDYVYKKALQYGEKIGNDNATQDLMRIADFILSNMSFHHGVSESTLDLYLNYYKSWSASSQKVSELVDSIEHREGRLNIQNLEYIDDMVIIDKEQLWQYILDMYNFRNSSKICRKFKDNVFLEYILPYRVGNEPLNLKWKTEADNTIYEIKDSIILRNDLNVRDAANLAMKFWNVRPFKWTDGLPKGCTLGVKGLTVKAGNCRDFGVGAMIREICRCRQYILQHSGT